jgi:hypothetical protein
VAAVLQRRSYTILRGRKLYANIFAFLVGPPGVGKTTAIIEAREVIKKVSAVKLMPAKVTPERFINLLSKAHTLLPAEVGQFPERTASATLLMDELSVFIQHHNYDFLSILADLFDCPPLWENSTISREEDRCENVHVNLLGGITPKAIAENIGERGFGLGFTSRIIFVYANSLEEQGDIFELSDEPDRSVLISTLRTIHKLAGKFSPTEDASAFVREWRREKMEPYPSDPRFAEYLTRRLAHWLKLSLIISASRRDSRSITLEDVRTAKAWLLEAEAAMPGAVELVGKNPIFQAIEDAHRWMLVQHMTNGRRGVPESALRNKLSHSVPIQFHNQAIDLMLTTNRIACPPGALELPAPNRLFIPIPLQVL